MSIKNSRFYCVQLLQFYEENIFRLFKNRSRGAGVDQNDIKVAFCMKNWCLRFIISLKHLSNFRRSLDLSLINCKIELDLSWSKNCIISEISRTPYVAANSATNPPRLYVPAITFSIKDNIKFLRNIKQGFKRTVSWHKYRTGITTQPKNNNLGYLIDPDFRNINRLFILSFKNGENDPTTNSFDKQLSSIFK